MKAVGYKKSLPIEDANSLIDFETAKPEPKGRDIRVAVKAISANPVDYKVRKRAAPPEGETKILGYDAAGIVDAVGPDVTLFKAGDEVFYAGSILRQGTNSEFHLVDERIVGPKPKFLSFAQAAALPLTSITAWELLFDRLGAVPGKSVDHRTLFGLIDDPPEFTVSAFKGKAISIHWESMFTRSSFQTADMIAQHHLLNDVADLLDKGVLRTTLDQSFGTINATNLKRAHALLESGKSRGKIVLEGW